MRPADIYRRDGISFAPAVRLHFNTVGPLKAYSERTDRIVDNMRTLDIWDHGALGSSESCLVNPMCYFHAASHIHRLDQANIAGAVMQVDDYCAFNRPMQFMVFAIRIRKMSASM